MGLKRMIERGLKRSSPRASLEFRHHEGLLAQGRVTPKFSRILPFVPGTTVVEMGAAEGVLSLLLAEKKKKVWAVERSKERHERAKSLQVEWLREGFPVEACEMIHGDVFDHADLLHSADTFLAVRALYYLGQEIEDAVATLWKSVDNVVLVGNRSRSERHFATRSSTSPWEGQGANNYYATLDGMWQLVTRQGFDVRYAVPDGDPIIVATRGAKKSTT